MSLRGDHPGQQADEVRDAHQQRHGQHAGQDARGGQHRHRVAAQRVERVDLLGDLHGPELGGDARAHPADDHDRRQHRAQLEDHARGHDAAEDVERDRARELVAALLRGHDAGQDRRDHHQGQALHAHRVELAHEVAHRDLAPEEGHERPPGEDPHPARVPRHRRSHATDGPNQAGRCLHHHFNTMQKCMPPRGVH